MSATSAPATGNAAGAASTDPYAVGTLRYARAGSVRLFARLKLQHLKARHWIIALVMSTVPGFLSMATVSPWASFRSDRHRVPRGRRIPSILSTLPVPTCFLLLLGFSEQIGHALHTLLSAFFNRFVNTVVWYLSNDVVPPLIELAPEEPPISDRPLVPAMATA